MSLSERGRRVVRVCVVGVLLPGGSYPKLRLREV